MVKFNSTIEDDTIITKIVKRAKVMIPKLNSMDLEMDITACHCNGNPLKLQELLDSDDGNFGHDVFGIQRFIDRKTGKLTQYFSPRYSA
jgi:hypothetical protein